MPFCPKCRFEYEYGVSFCPDCNERLVPTLPEEDGEDRSESEAAYDDWVPIARLTSQQYAEMVLEGLRSKNIPAVVRHGSPSFGHTGVSSFGPGIGSYHTLLVPRKFVTEADEEAELILGEVWSRSRLDE